MKKAKRFVYELVTPSKKGNIGYYFDLFIIILILLSIIDIILESEESLKLSYGRYFNLFEKISVVVFWIEYLFTIWTINQNPAFKKARHPRIKYALTSMALIDLIAILPFFLPFISADMRVLRIFRVFKVFRILKMAKYTKAFELIRKVLINKKEELAITLSFIAIILILISTLMYYVEHEAQPQHFSSIASSLWWGVITLTTVGYGDVVPITSIGKILNGIITLISLGLIALPSGIIASGYTEEIIKSRKQK